MPPSRPAPRPAPPPCPALPRPVPQDYSETLYENFAKEFKSYIDKRVAPALDATSTDEAFMSELIRRWENHLHLTRFMSKWFNYLDRYYVPR